MTDMTPLGELIEQLHEVNRQVSEATRPLDRLDDLDAEHRKQLAAQMRAALERWEVVTKQISQALTQKQDGGAQAPLP